MRSILKRATSLLLAVAVSICVLTSPAAALGKDTAKAASYSVKVSYKATLVSNNHVGNSWSKKVTFNGKTVSAGSSKTITLKAKDTVKIVCKATENDKIPDVGTGTLTFKVSDLKSGKNTKTKYVYVTENRGRYSGKQAKWKFTVTITKTKK